MAGAGITVVPHYLCEAELANGILVLLHRPRMRPHNVICLAWNKVRAPALQDLFVRDTLVNAARGGSPECGDAPGLLPFRCRGVHEERRA